jgi:tryptophan synthase alpha chain
MHEALEAGVTPRDVMAAVERARQGAGAGVGLVAMVSVSIVGRVGAKRFVADAASAGFDGFIFPDAPVEESEELIGLARDAGLIASLLVSPTTPPERAARIASVSSGFVYLMARVGITGEAPGAAVDTAGIRRRVDELRAVTDLPIACGFGIATPEHVAAVVSDTAGGADAAIVGSALVKRMGRAAAEGRDPVEAAESFALGLGVGLRPGA